MGNAVIGRAFDDFFGHRKTYVGVFRYSSLVVGDRDHRGFVLGHQGQYALEHLVLSGHGVHQCFALIDGQACLEGFDNGRIDAEWHIGNRLHQLHRLGQNTGLVSQWNACVHVEHVGASLDLRQCVGLDPAVVAVFHFFGEDLAARGVNALANNDEGLIEANVDFTGRGTDGGRGHECCLILSFMRKESKYGWKLN